MYFDKFPLYEYDITANQNRKQMRKENDKVPPPLFVEKNNKSLPPPNGIGYTIC